MASPDLRVLSAERRAADGTVEVTYQPALPGAPAERRPGLRRSQATGGRPLLDVWHPVEGGRPVGWVFVQVDMSEPIRRFRAGREVGTARRWRLGIFDFPACRIDTRPVISREAAIPAAPEAVARRGVVGSDADVELARAVVLGRRAYRTWRGQ